MGQNSEDEESDSLFLHVYDTWLHAEISPNQGQTTKEQAILKT